MRRAGETHDYDKLAARGERPHAKRGQSAFEYLLLIGGGVLFVILAVAVVRTAINTNQNAANNTAGGYQTFLSNKGDYALYFSAVNASCVGAWSFNEGSGTVTVDSSTSHYNGTLLNGPTWVTGIKSNALSFDGTDDYVQFGNAPNVEIQGDITISAWVKSNADGQTGNVIIRSGTGGDMLYRLNGASFQNYYNGTQGEFLYYTLTSGRWLHVVAVRQIPNAYVYVNGALNASATNWVLGPSQNPSNTVIASPGQIFNGTIDEIAVYNRAFTADEVAALYRANSTWCT